ncbi:hypothetical protein RRG08_040755 [Elysia crispata]|uniref:Uncharacterized protein n=1 Tax=Elysia crispata TaxID=231223 RepID=A0AAE1BDE1_9GAST|nr:hypothetical protein RRG08_040755 [Elysia crispata]
MMLRRRMAIVMVKLRRSFGELKKRSLQDVSGMLHKAPCPTRAIKTWSKLESSSFQNLDLYTTSPSREPLPRWIKVARWGNWKVIHRNIYITKVRVGQNQSLAWPLQPFIWAFAACDHPVEKQQNNVCCVSGKTLFSA